jgi:hypothetical protein
MNDLVRLKGTDRIYRIASDRIKQGNENIGYVYHYRLVNIASQKIAFWMEDQLEKVE